DRAAHPGGGAGGAGDLPRAGHLPPVARPGAADRHVRAEVVGLGRAARGRHILVPQPSCSNARRRRTTSCGSQPSPGIEDTSSWVYGCCGERSTSDAGPCSTTVPWNSTSTASEASDTTWRSWLTN